MCAYQVITGRNQESLNAHHGANIKRYIKSTYQYAFPKMNGEDQG
jgi:hypothetical protein